MSRLTGLVVAVVLLGSASARAEHTRASNPNAASLELLGRGMLWSVNYDRAIGDDMAAGFGFGTVGTDRGTSATLLPTYFMYYFAREQGSFFASAGATVAANANAIQDANSTTGNFTFTSSPIIPTIGAGYENRADAGYLVRFAGYLFVTKRFSPWIGIDFGYSF